MRDEKRAADAYAAKMDPATLSARFAARVAAMLTRYETRDAALVALDAELKALLDDYVAQGLTLIPPGYQKDYEVFTRQIFRVASQHPFNVLSREFGGFVSLWRDRGLSYPWLRRIGLIIFDIPEDAMDHALLTHLAYAEAGHTGFAPAANGSPTASAPGDSSADGSSASPSHSDHKHAREAFGSAAGTVCQGNDARLSDARTPTTHGDDKHNTHGFEWPDDPEIGQLFYREDLLMQFFWGGTYWLSVQLFTLDLTTKRTMPFSASDDICMQATQKIGQGAYLVRLDWMAFFDTIQTGTNYWTWHLDRVTEGDAAGTGVDNFNSQGLSKDVWHGGSRELVYVDTNATIGYIFRGAKSASGGAIQMHASLRYRVIGPAE